MMSSKQKVLIKASLPRLKQHLSVNTTSQHSGKEQVSFTSSILAYADGIRNPSPEKALREEDLSAEFFAVAGQQVLASIREIFGEEAIPGLIEAWDLTIRQFTGLLIKHASEGLRKADTANQNSAWRYFCIRKIIKESQEVTSFYLSPADGAKINHFVPGQYVSIRLFLPGMILSEPRQYSLSNSPNGSYYRISVKRESGTGASFNGRVSHCLFNVYQPGDIIEVAAPAGSFTLDTNRKVPVVLISGGVGQTPLMSMAEHLVFSGSGRQILWIHGSRNEAVHAFRKQIAEMAVRHKSFRPYIFYDRVNDRAGDIGLYQGVVDLPTLGADVILPDADYYICGPTPFIKKQLHDLAVLGIRKEDIHIEDFGSALVNCPPVSLNNTPILIP